GDLGVDFRLVLAHPGDLGRGEARHGDIAGDFPKAGLGGLHLGAFGKGTAVVPEDAGPQHLVIGAEQRGAVHVAGKPDARDGGELGRPGGPELVDGPQHRTPPVGRSCSDQPGCGRTGSLAAAVASPRTLPAASISSALTPEVPTSMPRNVVMTYVPHNGLLES